MNIFCRIFFVGLGIGVMPSLFSADAEKKAIEQAKITNTEPTLSNFRATHQLSILATTRNDRKKTIPLMEMDTTKKLNTPADIAFRQIHKHLTSPLKLYQQPSETLNLAYSYIQNRIYVYSKYLAAASERSTQKYLSRIINSNKKQKEAIEQAIQKQQE